VRIGVGRRNLIPNSDAQTYSRPPPQVLVFPLWAYHQFLPPEIAVNAAQLNGLIAQGFTPTYQPPYPTPNVPPPSVAARVPSGITDNFAPKGYISGFTSRLVLQPTDATSTLSGLVAASDGWIVAIFNLSTPVPLSPPLTPPLTLLNRASSTPGNSFVLSGSANLVLPSEGASYFQWLSAVNGWMEI
jgi:hypothetical protein